jgi:hypothetical protein
MTGITNRRLFRLEKLAASVSAKRKRTEHDEFRAMLRALNNEEFYALKAKREEELAALDREIAAEIARLEAEGEGGSGPLEPTDP